jgi:hypothetical protein
MRTWKPVPADYRYSYAYLALIPAALALGLGLHHWLPSQSHPVLAWLLLASAGVVTYIGSLLWAKRVPSIVSLYLGLLLWAATLWMAWHGQI